MTRYINIETMEYPITELMIREQMPLVSFCNPFQPITPFQTVYNTVVPVADVLQTVVEINPNFDIESDMWLRAYKVIDMFKDIEVEGVLVTKAEQEEAYLLAKFKATVPKTITPRQARLVLLGAGLLDDIEVLLATDKTMQIWWEYSLEVDRDNAHIVTAGTALGLTELQLDEMFIAASKI